MAETEPAVTIPEVEAPTFDPITIDLKIPGLGASISSGCRPLRRLHAASASH